MNQVFTSLSDPLLTARIMQGAVGVLPTDTVYGLVCRVYDQDAVARLYSLKHRHHKPGTIIAANSQQLIDLGIDAEHISIAQQWWPNSLSIIVPCGDKLDYLHMGLKSLAVRVPADETVAGLLLETGPLLTTSANQPGHPGSVTVGQAQEYFGETVDYYVDGGDLSYRSPSTIARLSGGTLQLVRSGAVTIT